RLRLTPAREPLANVSGIYVQRVANVLEGEDPGVVVRVEPLAGLPEQASPAAVGGEGIVLVAPHRLLQDGEHETSLALERDRSRFSAHRCSCRRSCPASCWDKPSPHSYAMSSSMRASTAASKGFDSSRAPH